MPKPLAASAGAVVAALLGALCCVGPMAFVSLGIGAGLAGRFEPLRPVFGVAMSGAFALAYRTVYGRRDASDASATCVADDDACTTRLRQRDRAILGTAAALALLLWLSPAWERLFV